MTEYIERGALPKPRYIDIDAFLASENVNNVYGDYWELKEKLDEIPAADVEPVVRAKWEREFKEVPVKDGSRCVMKVLYKCAGEYGCKEYSIINSKRCPNCGAHMGKRSEHED